MLADWRAGSRREKALVLSAGPTQKAPAQGAGPTRKAPVQSAGPTRRNVKAAARDAALNRARRSWHTIQNRDSAARQWPAGIGPSHN
jgi:hypothetical protein